MLMYIIYLPLLYSPKLQLRLRICTIFFLLTWPKGSISVLFLEWKQLLKKDVEKDIMKKFLFYQYACPILNHKFMESTLH